MKKIIILCLFISFGLIVYTQDNPCDPSVLNKALSQLDENTIFLKDFHIYLPPSENNKILSEKFSMVLNDSTTYQFSIAHSKEYPGKAVFQLYDGDKLLGSTYNTRIDRNYESFFFKCKKQGIYHMFISFVDGKEGCAVGVLAYKEKFE